MKRAMSFLLIAAWAAVGCQALPRLWEQPKPAAAPDAGQPGQARPVVTADQISEANARAAADALDDEIKHDAHGDLLPPRAK